MSNYLFYMLHITRLHFFLGIYLESPTCFVICHNIELCPHTMMFLNHLLHLSLHPYVFQLFQLQYLDPLLLWLSLYCQKLHQRLILLLLFLSNYLKPIFLYVRPFHMRHITPPHLFLETAFEIPTSLLILHNVEKYPFAMVFSNHLFQLYLLPLLFSLIHYQLVGTILLWLFPQL